MNAYQAHASECASGVELTIALYDGIHRFMRHAIDAVERNDVDARRAAVKRAMDIVIYLQATLDMNVSGKVGKTLSDFYTAMFALMLQGSQANSKKKFEQVIANVRNVREAWKQVAVESNSRPAATAEGMISNRASSGAETQWSPGDHGPSGATWRA